MESRREVAPHRSAATAQKWRCVGSRRQNIFVDGCSPQSIATYLVAHKVAVSKCNTIVQIIIRCTYFVLFPRRSSAPDSTQMKDEKRYRFSLDLKFRPAYITVPSQPGPTEAEAGNRSYLKTAEQKRRTEAEIPTNRVGMEATRTLVGESS